MKIYSHTLKIDGLTLCWQVNEGGSSKRLIASKPRSEITGKNIIDVCEQLGADFDCLRDSNGEPLTAKSLPRLAIKFILHDLSTADDLFRDTDDTYWWSPLEPSFDMPMFDVSVRR
ncbi:hypothetical protein P88_00560 [Erwinia phage phiEt88]|uniref:hypothetical protein n=1 Tax=Erwinia phage phiEt88 TaxID=925984 RepID=UPI0001F1FC88|nr:hypothetical protein ErPhphiEt88_gp56 [Erwinia phage phiEt88]CBX44567.1 hypothetical protein P88_00560 [Erwinia phage phiEt88]